MAATVASSVDFTVPGAVRKSVKVIAADASYPTGGYQLTAAMFGFTTLQYCLPSQFAAVPVGCAEFLLNPATNKLQFLVSAGTEVTNGTSLAGTQVVVEAYGY